MRNSILIFVLLVLAVTPLSPALAKGSAPPGVDRQEVVFVTDKILCDCGCHPQSVYDCACGRSEEMWREFGALVQSTGSGEAALASYIAEHGEIVLVTPKAEGFNLLAWLGPLAGLLLAAVGLILITRRWSGRSEEDAAVTGESTEPLDEAYLNRLNQDLEKMQ